MSGRRQFGTNNILAKILVKCTDVIPDTICWSTTCKPFFKVLEMGLISQMIDNTCELVVDIGIGLKDMFNLKITIEVIGCAHITIKRHTNIATKHIIFSNIFWNSLLVTVTQDIAHSGILMKCSINFWKVVVRKRPFHAYILSSKLHTTHVWRHTYLRIFPFHKVKIHLIEQLMCLLHVLIILIKWPHLKAVLFRDETPSNILDAVAMTWGLVLCNLNLTVSEATNY